MILRQCKKSPRLQAVLFIAVCFFASNAYASVGDRLPEFRECVEVNT
jgi:hypothetical protein